MTKEKLTMTLTRSDGTTYQDDSITLGRAEVKSYPIDNLPDLTQVAYPPVGRCIYCGSTAGLTREHIVPYGLNGELVLPSASCTKCAAATSKCELQVLRKLLQTVRMLRCMRSRRKHASATRYAELKFVKDGQPRTKRIAIEEFPFLLHLPKFATPGYLTGGYEGVIRIDGVFTLLFGPDPKDVAQKLGAQEITIDSDGYEPIPFARMLAKIAYGYAFASKALARIESDCPVLPAILGERDDIGRWVGTLDGPARRYPGALHRIVTHEDQGLLIMEVQLFADAGAPSYGVILGRLQGSTGGD